MENSIVEDNFDFLLPPTVVFVNKEVDYDLMMKTDLEINKFIADEKKWRKLYDRMPDRGDKLKETLRRYEAELERRNKRKSHQEGYEADLFHDDRGKRQTPVAGDVEAPLAKRLHSGRKSSPCDCLPDEKMRKIVNELVRIGLSGIDVGKAAENCYNDPVKFKVLFTLPSHMRKDYASMVLVST